MMTSTRRRPRLSSSRRRATPRGFTIVELIVAIMIMTVGVLGLASSAALVSRMMGGGAQQSQAANVALSRFERLRNVAWRCSNLTSGSATTRGMQETWTVAPSGSARAVRVTVTVRFKAPTYDRTRSTYVRTQTYRSLVLCG